MQAPAGGIPGFALAHTSIACSHSRTEFVFICVLAESQGASWQDLRQQPWRLTEGPAEAHAGVGPRGLQAHWDRGPQTQQQATR